MSLLGWHVGVEGWLLDDLTDGVRVSAWRHDDPAPIESVRATIAEAAPLVYEQAMGA